MMLTASVDSCGMFMVLGEFSIVVGGRGWTVIVSWLQHCCLRSLSSTTSAFRFLSWSTLFGKKYGRVIFSLVCFC